MTIQLYNTLTSSITEFIPKQEGNVKIYSCGPTVYNNAHIGNLRAFLFADILQRTLRTVGKYSVEWVMNITDVDDKTIRDSAIGSEKWRQEMGQQTDSPLENLRSFTQYYEKQFINDISTIGIELQHFTLMPRATDYISEMQDLITKIYSNGFAYVSNGSVYFNLKEWRKSQKYGLLFHIDEDEILEGVRIDADEYERNNVSDFVLWKASKENEPSWIFQLNGQTLIGRPGWHIECSAMGHKLLGLPFDIHTGGVDLRFPHHEDEIAQSFAGYGVAPASFWCHNEFLEVEGKKMSKSLGNFYTLSDILNQGFDPLDVRFSMLSAHYSSVYNFTHDGITSARKSRKKIQEWIYALYMASNSTMTIPFDSRQLHNEVFGHLANNIHTPKALATIFTTLNSIDITLLDDSSKKELILFFTELNNVFGVWHIGEKTIDESVIPDLVLRLAQERWEAKQAKDFSRADSLRAEVTALGYTIADTKDGYTVNYTE